MRGQGKERNLASLPRPTGCGRDRCPVPTGFSSLISTLERAHALQTGGHLSASSFRNSPPRDGLHCTTVGSCRRIPPAFATWRSWQRCESRSLSSLPDRSKGPPLRGRGEASPPEATPARTARESDDPDTDADHRATRDTRHATTKGGPARSSRLGIGRKNHDRWHRGNAPTCRDRATTVTSTHAARSKTAWEGIGPLSDSVP